MKRLVCFIIVCLLASSIYSFVQAQEKTVVITTSVGTMKARLYNDVPNHVRVFTQRANAGLFDGTLFSRVIAHFMIQGGAPDTKTAPAGARCGFGDSKTNILPEFRSSHISKKGVLAAPRQDVSVNPKKKSDMSQFFIVQGMVYRSGQLDTLELATNQKIRTKALNKYYVPVKAELQKLKESDPKEYHLRMKEIAAKIDSVTLATPGHLIFTPEQREAYTTVGGSPHLDGEYTIYGELIDGFDVLDKIAAQRCDVYDRPKKDVRIIRVRVQ